MQGFNMGRYVPPEHEGMLSFNQVSGKRTTPQTVRFEMPFPIWCTTCTPHPILIPQGVRFNAVKKRVGSYYSSPIFSFLLKHTPCGGTIEIRTDPKNTAYIVAEGARKKDTGEGRETEGVFLSQEELQSQILPDEGKEAAKRDAFAALETKVGDKEGAKKEERRIRELYLKNEREWEDVYTINQRMRKAFRVGRKEREGQAIKDEELRDRMGLEMEISKETEEDRTAAKLVMFGAETDEVRRRGLFDGAAMNTAGGAKSAKSANSGGGGGGGGVSTAAGKQSKTQSVVATKERLQKTLNGNTRAAVDPFLTERAVDKPRLLLGVKRKRSEAEPASNPKQGSQEEAATKQKPALVNDEYDSD